MQWFFFKSYKILLINFVKKTIRFSWNRPHINEQPFKAQVNSGKRNSTFNAFLLHSGNKSTVPPDPPTHPHTHTMCSSPPPTPASSISPLSKFSLAVHLSIFPIQVRQMPLRNFRAVEWKWWKPQAGSHCKTPAPRLWAQTPSFRSTSWNWGCFLIKALVDWARFSGGCEGNFKVALDRYI